MRDITLEDTIYVLFTTRSFSTGVPTTLAGTPVVSAYENDSATQITAGITLGVDHDSVTGLNLLTIVATAANGYEAGKDYSLVITTGTVGGVSVVGEVVGGFTIGRSASFTRLGAPAAASIAADLLAIDNFVDELESRLTAARAGYLDNLNGHTAQTGDSFARIGAAGASLTDLGGMSTAMKAEVNAEADTAISDAALGTAAELAKVPKSDGTSSWNATALGAINAEADTAISDAALATATALATVDANVDQIVKAANTVVTGTVDTVTNSHTPTTTEFQADDITEATADHYNGRVVIFTSGVLTNQATDITDYVAVGGIGQFTVTAMTEAPSNNDTFIIV